MKYGVHAGLWMARWTDELAPIVNEVADLGYDGVEVSLLGMTDEKAEALGKLVRDAGLEVTCSDGLAPERDITSKDDTVRVAGIEYLRWAISTAAKIGARGLAGVVYAPWGKFDHARKQERSDLAARALGELAGHLEACDVTLGLEAINRFETDLVNTAAEARAIAEAAGTERVGVLLDSFHLNIEEKDFAGAIGTAGDRLSHFHVSENDRGVPGSGHIPWGDVKKGLDSIGYDGWIVAEMFVMEGNPASADLNIWRPLEKSPGDAAERALEFMRKTFG